MNYKGLTVKQPFISYLIFGLKEYETDRPYTNYRGSIYLHASKGRMEKRDRMAAVAMFNEKISDINKKSQAIISLGFAGAIIGRIDIDNCLYTVENPTDPSYKNRNKVVISNLSRQEQDLGWWQKGKYAYKTSNPLSLSTAIYIQG